MIRNWLLPATTIIVAGGLVYVYYRHGELVPLSRLLDHPPDGDDEFFMDLEPVKDFGVDLTNIELQIQTSNDAIHITDSSELAPPFTGIWSHFSYEQTPAQLGAPDANAPTTTVAVLAQDLCLQPEESTSSANSGPMIVAIVVIVVLPSALLLVWLCKKVLRRRSEARSATHRIAHLPPNASSLEVEEASVRLEEVHEANDDTEHVEEAHQVDEEPEEADLAIAEVDEEANEVFYDAVDLEEIHEANDDTEHVEEAHHVDEKPEEADLAIAEVDEEANEVFYDAVDLEEVHDANDDTEHVEESQEVDEKPEEADLAIAEVDEETEEEVHEANDDTEYVEEAQEVAQEEEQHEVTGSDANSHLASNESAEYRSCGGASSNNAPTDLLSDVKHGETGKTSAESTLRMCATENSVETEVNPVSAFRGKWIESTCIAPPRVANLEAMALYVQQLSDIATDLMPDSTVALCSVQTKLDAFKHHIDNRYFRRELRKNSIALSSAQEESRSYIDALFSLNRTIDRVKQKHFDHALYDMTAELLKRWDDAQSCAKRLVADIQKLAERDSVRPLFAPSLANSQMGQELFRRMQSILDRFNEPMILIQVQCMVLETCALAANASGCSIFDESTTESKVPRPSKVFTDLEFERKIVEMRAWLREPAPRDKLVESRLGRPVVLLNQFGVNWDSCLSNLDAITTSNSDKRNKERVQEVTKALNKFYEMSRGVFETEKACEQRRRDLYYSKTLEAYNSIVNGPLTRSVRDETTERLRSAYIPKLPLRIKRLYGCKETLGIDARLQVSFNSALLHVKNLKHYEDPIVKYYNRLPRSNCPDLDEQNPENLDEFVLSARYLVDTFARNWINLLDELNSAYTDYLQTNQLRRSLPELPANKQRYEHVREILVASASFSMMPLALAFVDGLLEREIEPDAKEDISRLVLTHRRDLRTLQIEESAHNQHHFAALKSVCDQQHPLKFVKEIDDEAPCLPAKSGGAQVSLTKWGFRRGIETMTKDITLMRGLTTRLTDLKSSKILGLNWAVCGDRFVWIGQDTVGQTLEDYIRQKGGMPPYYIRRVLRQVIKGLRDIEATGLRLCELNSSMIIITKGKHIWINPLGRLRRAREGDFDWGHLKTLTDELLQRNPDFGDMCIHGDVKLAPLLAEFKRALHTSDPLHPQTLLDMEFLCNCRHCFARMGVNRALDHQTLI